MGKKVEVRFGVRGEGRYDPNSVVNVQKRKDDRKFNLRKDDDLWTDSERRRLLEMWYEGLPFRSEDPRGCLLGRLGRSYKSITTQLVKMGDNIGGPFYPFGNFLQDGSPAPRDMAPWSDRERQMLKYATSKVGTGNGANSLEHMALITGRSMSAIRYELRQMEKKVTFSSRNSCDAR